MCLESRTPQSDIHKAEDTLSSENDSTCETSDHSSTSSYEFLSSSEELETETPSMSFSKPRIAIQETIDRLHRLAAIIRRSGTHHRQLRIERFSAKKENREVYDTFKRYALQKVDHLFPKASPALRERMAESIARRRNRFSYIKKHQQKISTLKEALPLSSTSTTHQEKAKPLPPIEPESAELPVTSVP